MEQYIDVKLKPDSIIQESPLMNLVYNRLHRAIVTLKTGEIGVSFPDHKIKLGNVLRIHGSINDLHNLLALNWLDNLSEHCDVLKMNTIPASVKYRTISRVRSNMSKSKLRRLQKRGTISEGDEKKYIRNMFSKGLDNPYVDLVSSSTGETFRMFLSFGPILDQPVYGKYDTYGLSKDTTIPWF